MLQEALQEVQAARPASGVTPEQVGEGPGLPVRLISLPSDRIVVVGETAVHTEDPEGSSSAQEVAEQLAEALGAVVQEVDLSDRGAFAAFLSRHGIDLDGWSYGPVTRAVLEEVGEDG